MGNKQSSQISHSSKRKKGLSTKRSTRINPHRVKKQLESLTGRHANGSSTSVAANPKTEALRQKLMRISSSAERHCKDSINSLKSQAESIVEIDYKKYEYPFENLVFEGGGAKGQVYIGCLQVSLDFLSFLLCTYCSSFFSISVQLANHVHVYKSYKL